ncbi:hypothetical protein BGZ70_005035 [Mortierella alpina]|uniref:Golgi apparatus membrane protein TVP38 n=1 Tax=Mortierella alpina TaxID=64518 RepID=A0A9P6J9G1_MORAP|nr:hypothetical protein BGZ70_005035 [Mortierella alpina]
MPEPPPLFPASSASSYTPVSGSHGNDTHHSATTPARLSRSSSIDTSPRHAASASFGSASNRFANDSLTALNGVNDALPPNVQPWFWLALWFAFAVLIIGLITGFHSKIFDFLEALASFIKGLGPLGPPVIMLSLFATSFPPMIGYSSVVTMSGYVYGFVQGFLIAFSSALMGAIVCFYFCRRWFKAQVRKLLAKNKSLKSVVRTVEKRGFKLLVLIRLAPYPFNIMNALLSATHIPLPTFALATAISLVKLTLHVYIGSTLSSLAGGDDDQDDKGKGGHGKAVKIIVMILSIILGIGVGGYVWIVAKREIAVSEALRIERRRQRRRRHDNGGGRGIELSDQRVIPDFDLTNHGRGDGFLGGEGRPFGVGHGYHDEDEEEHEDRSLFGGLSLGRREQHEQGGDWRNVGANVDSSTDSDMSDSFDEDEEEGEDLDGGDIERQGFHPRGSDDLMDEALDFSAHHMNPIESPWQDEEGLEDGAPSPRSNLEREGGWGH